ncbi:hypothetical protein F444_04150 [Phytophthora nicotianae P1976]|uniref:Uncharacterized protein n=1 Tax=Phytophthora nicotianae P1976 TaxID=1317066 RepID=A0A081ARP9_PHYNI|nr:hypothetical protein F444_04150 [Phytophthora nicotianae P1976]
MNEQHEDASTYEDTFMAWALHDGSVIVDARSPGKTRSLFERFRVARGNSATVTRTVTIRSLDKAWTALVSRWNKEGGAAFERMLKSREAVHERLSVSALAAQICGLSSWIVSAASRTLWIDVHAVALEPWTAPVKRRL